MSTYNRSQLPFPELIASFYHRQDGGTVSFRNTGKKVKQFRYRPEQSQRVPGS